MFVIHRPFTQWDVWQRQCESTEQWTVQVHFSRVSWCSSLNDLQLKRPTLPPPFSYRKKTTYKSKKRTNICKLLLNTIPKHNTIFQTISIQETILENSTILATVHISSWFTLSHLLCNAFWENNLIQLPF